jgi:hypothetical protein
MQQQQKKLTPIINRKETFDKIWNKIKTKVQNEKNAVQSPIYEVT